MYPGYLAHARALDVRHSAAGTTPIEDRLRSFTAVRGLVFGAYGEASDDVHFLVRHAAEAIAGRVWQTHGARSEAEMLGMLSAQLRRRMGLQAVRAMARHRLARVPFIGVSRQAVIDRQANRLRDANAAYAPQAYYSEFYAFQAGGHRLVAA